MGVAYGRQKNIKEFLVRAKVPPRNAKTKRNLKGMKKCNKPCQACPFTLEGIQITGDKFDWKITTPANCKTKNIVYMIECNKENCKQRYIGKSKKTIVEKLKKDDGPYRKERETFLINKFNTYYKGIN